MDAGARPLLVVTGTRREGALAAGEGVIVLAGGGDQPCLAEDLAKLAPGACGILSYGTCGGLALGLPLGEMVIGEHVVGTAKAACDPSWIGALVLALPRARRGAVFANGTLLTTVAQKRAAAATGAIAADMESHIVAGAAARFGLPFAVLRCISDLADTALPPAVAVAMRPDGGLALAAILGSVLRYPGQLPALLRAGADFGRSFAALKAGTQAVGPRLAFDRRVAGAGHPNSGVA